MLTAKGETYDKVLGLELGADDYIVKPFDAKEVTAASRPCCAAPPPRRRKTRAFTTLTICTLT